MIRCGSSLSLDRFLACGVVANLERASKSTAWPVRSAPVRQKSECGRQFARGEHPGTSNNYDNYEKKCANLNFGLARVTI